MLKTLLKKQISEIFRSYFYDAKKNRARSSAATAVYIVLFVIIMVVLLGGVFTALSVSICAPLADAGMSWLYFALMGLLSVLFGAFGSVFNTYSGLYLAKDNDLLLSMPIPVRYIMISRLLSVYLMGLMYSAVIIVPAVIVYWITAPAGAAAIMGGILLVLLISVFVLTLSCALGWVVAKISLKLKNRSFITVIISLLFFGAYYFFCFRAQTLISSLVANAAVLGGKIKGAAYPVYLFGNVAVGDGIAMLAVSAVVLALFALMWTLISRSFLKLATSSGKTERRVYRETAFKRRSISSALLSKELGRFTGSPSYMLNCGLGILLLPLCGVMLLIKGGAAVSLLNQVFASRPGAIPVLLCSAVCLLASMNDITSPSVSLEGKNLWLVQSLPVTPWQVLRAKLSLQIALTAPGAVFCLICSAFIYPFSPVQLILCVVEALLYTALTAMLGLMLGLKMPNLTWTSEITPIKQSASVMISLFGGFLLAAAVFAVYGLAGYRLGFTPYMLLAAALTLAVCAALYGWLRRRGAALFRGL